MGDTGKSYNETTGERSSEEIEWDKEFQDETRHAGEDVTATLADLTKLAVSIPLALLRMPGMMLPRETRHHARAAVRETFLAARSLLGAVGDSIEGLLSDPAESAPTHSGPAGTWGTGRAAGTSSPRAGDAKLKRISLSDEGDSSGTSQAAGQETPADIELPDDRGLRADIDY